MTELHLGASAEVIRLLRERLTEVTLLVPPAPGQGGALQPEAATADSLPAGLYRPSVCLPDLTAAVQEVIGKVLVSNVDQLLQPVKTASCSSLLT